MNASAWISLDQDQRGNCRVVKANYKKRAICVESRIVLNFNALIARVSHIWKIDSWRLPNKWAIMVLESKK
jgi:hypothetical protein